MARLPQPGGDSGNWGNILNDYLAQSIAPDGTLKSDSVGTSQLAPSSVTAGSISDGAVERIKLSAAVRTELDGKLANNIVVTPMNYGGIGDGATIDAAALSAAVTALPAGGTLNLAGRTYRINSQWVINKRLTIRDGNIVCATDRVALVTAAGVIFSNVTFTREGSGGANAHGVVINANSVQLQNCSVVSADGSALRMMGSGVANGTKIIGGYYEAKATNSDISTAIELTSGGHSYDVVVSGAKVRHTGYGTGIGLYNCSRCVVEKCDVRSMRRAPLFTFSGWTQTSGTVYRAADRTDGINSNIIYVNGVSYPEGNATNPAVGTYGSSNDGWIYINTGSNPNSATITGSRTNGYGILFYATTSETLGMSDNEARFNYVEDTDGFGIYHQNLQNTPRRNKTIGNTLNNVCLTGRGVQALPFAGIGYFGGLDIVIEGNTVTNVGTSSLPAPGIKIIANVPVPESTATLRNNNVQYASSNGFEINAGYYILQSCTARFNGMNGLAIGTAVAGVNYYVEAHGCIFSDNGTAGSYSGVNLEGSAGLKTFCAYGGRYERNSLRGINLASSRDIKIIGAVFAANAQYSVQVSDSISVAISSNTFISGQGISLLGSTTDISIGPNQFRTPSTKINTTLPYKISGGEGVPSSYVVVGSPESAITAPIGSIAYRSDGGAGTTMYVKESGTGNTGWIAK
jgi:hypothetical protein